ncbi:LysM peptidoglycan-binding domain-containing protein, partial [Kitasatospora nipponensis]|uniref:LysM peptidoglycan-binding domain-containing protein n=1 Tax=Kitasatospora nipponensis TaxID=258049 RepID=UPI0031D05B23
MAAPRAKVHARAGASAAGRAGTGGAPSSDGAAGRRGKDTRPSWSTPRGSAARPPARRESPLRSLPAALGALLVLAALLAGVPTLLLYGTHAVAAMGGVGHRSIGQLLTTPDDGRLFLWALVGIGWLGWACFALSVLLEIPAQLRGRVARRIPTFGWSQRMAAGLVGVLIALLPVAGASFAATTGPAQLTAPAVPAQIAAAPQYAALAAAPPAAPTAALPAAAPQAQQPSYTVRDSRPADSLWTIAEHQLGDGSRWQEIAKLNAGRVMDASGVHFDAERPIQPGWQLLMPADARPDGGPGASTPASGTGGGASAGSGAATAGAAGHATATVHEGDSLSVIAQREMGSSDAWPQLFDANKGVQAPDGERLTDPDVLAPGMVLTIPGAPAAPPAAPPAPPAPPAAQSPPAQAPNPGATVPATAASAPNTPAPPAGSAAPAHPSAAPVHPSAAPDAAAHPGAGATARGRGAEAAD